MESLEQVKGQYRIARPLGKVQQEPAIILDVAHNPEGMQYLTANLAALKETRPEK